MRYNLTGDETTFLLAQAEAAAKHAYAPYSNLAVGAALLTTDGTVFTGANVENASYGATVCAERLAIASAVVAGKRGFKALAVVSPGKSKIYPCGICRQFLAEFALNCFIITGTRHNPKTYSLKELLPHTFQMPATNE